MIVTAADPVPAPAADRLDLLDAARGIALAGIFLMNLGVFSGFVFMPPEAIAALPTATIDRPVGFLSLWLTYGKFYSIFSLLFGIGFSLQLAAASRRGDGRLSVFRRRLAVLATIGFVHMYFWEGDILLLYALVGFLLIPFQRVAQSTLVRVAALLVLAPVLLQIAYTLTSGALNPGAPLWRAGEAALVALGYPADAMPFPWLRDAGWRDYLRFQLSGGFFRYADLLGSGRPFKVLAMFVLGLWVGRSGLLRDLARHEPLLRRIRRVGFTVGLPFAALQTVLMLAGLPPHSWLRVLETAAYALGVAPLALAYAASLALAWQSPRRRAWLGRFAPAGRLALTNYLTQTTIGIGLFYGVGLGLMGRAGPTLWIPLVAAVITIQVLWSRWWLARFEFGPFEWLWRCATYGRRLPLRRAPAITTAAARGPRP